MLTYRILEDDGMYSVVEINLDRAGRVTDYDDAEICLWGTSIPNLRQAIYPLLKAFEKPHVTFNYLRTLKETGDILPDEDS